MSISINASEDSKQRFRNFASIVYPDSAPEDFIEYLSGLHIPIFVSPLHDLDINPNNEPKKPHYHILLMFEGKKSTKQIMDLLKPINCVGLEVVCSIRSYARYLIHADDPNKAQYKADDVVCLGGSDYFGICNLAIDKYQAIGEMMDFCADNRIVSFSYFLRYCKNNHFDWYRILCDKASYVMNEYLKSLSWELDKYDGTYDNNVDNV